MLNEKSQNHKTDQSLIFHILMKYEEKLFDQNKQVKERKQEIKGFKEKEYQLKDALDKQIEKIHQNKEERLSKNRPIFNNTGLQEMEDVFQDIIRIVNELKDNSDKNEQEAAQKTARIKEHKKLQNELQQKVEAFQRENKTYKRREKHLKGKLKTKQYLMTVHEQSKKELMKKIKNKNTFIQSFKHEENERKQREIDNEKVYMDKVVDECEDIRQKMNERKIDLRYIKTDMVEAIDQIKQVEKNVHRELVSLHEKDKGWWIEMWNFWNNERDAETKENVEKIREDIQGLKDELSSYKNMIENMQRNEKDDSRIEELLHELTSHRKSVDYSNKEDDINQLKMKEQDYKDQIKEMENKYQSLKHQYSVLEQKMEEEEIQNSGMDSNYEKMKEKYDQKLKKLYDRLKSYEKKNWELKQKVGENDKLMKTYQQNSSAMENSKNSTQMSQPNMEQYYNIPLPSSKSQTTVFNPYKYNNHKE